MQLLGTFGLRRPTAKSKTLGLQRVGIYTADEYIKMKRWKLKQFANLENVLIAVSVGSFVLAMILGLLSISQGRS